MCGPKIHKPTPVCLSKEGRPIDHIHAAPPEQRKKAHHYFHDNNISVLLCAPFHRENDNLCSLRYGRRRGAFEFDNHNFESVKFSAFIKLLIFSQGKAMSESQMCKHP